MIGRLDGSVRLTSGVELLHHLVAGIGIEAEDRAEVHGGGVEQLQTVGLGPASVSSCG